MARARRTWEEERRREATAEAVAGRRRAAAEASPRHNCGAPRQNQKSCLCLWRTAFPPHTGSHTFERLSGQYGFRDTPDSSRCATTHQPRAQAVVCVVLLHPIETTSHTSIAPLSSQPTLLPCSCNPPQREPRRPASHAAFACIWFTITSHRTPIGNALHPV